MFTKDLKKDKEYLIPLTDMQKEMIVAIGAGIYNFEEKLLIEFVTEINLEKLEKALRKVIKANPVMRSIIKWKAQTEPFMIVLKEIELPLYLEEKEELKVDLEKEPWNITISNKNKIIFRYSHLLLDGWSLSEFLNQLFQSYNNASMSDYADHSFRRYVMRTKQNNNLKNDLFWDKYWKGFEPNLLQNTFISENRDTKKYNTWILEESDVEKIDAFAEKNNLTFSAVLYAAWSLVLSSWTRKNDVCFGIITSGRNSSFVKKETIGLFMKHLPLRIKLEKNYIETCKNITQLIPELLKREDDSIQTIYGSVGKVQRKNLYDSIVVLENYPLDINRLTNELGISINNYSFEEDAFYPIVVKVQKGNQILIHIDTSEKISSSIIKALGDSLVHILRQLDERVHDSLELEVCPYRMVDKENGLKVENSILEQRIDRIIFDSCKKYSVRIAIIDGKKKISYNEVLKFCTNASRVLKAKGVKNQSTVGVYMDRGSELLLSVYAILLAGGVYIPFISSAPKKRIEYMMEQAEVDYVLCNHKREKDIIEKINSDVKVIMFHELKEYVEDEEETETIRENLDDAAYIIYTSGTTGNPKGAVISHKAIVNRLFWNSKEIGIEKNDVQLFKTPVSFDVSIIEIFQVFFSGHTLVVLPETFEKMPDKIIDYIHDYSVTYIHFVPTMLKQFISYIETMGRANEIISLDKIICSGEILHSVEVNKLYQDPLHYKGKVINLYGPTEAAVDVSCYICKGLQDLYTIPIGKPIYNTQLCVLDHEMRRCPPHVIGELYISGRNLGKGYINESILTKKYFRKLQDEKRFYYTGDLAYWNADGNLVVIGRSDTQIKFNGMRIESDEIKRNALEIKGVDDVEVVLKKENQDRLLLYYSGKSEINESIRRILGEKLPLNMLPTDIIWVKEMPKTINGKIDKIKLGELDSPCLVNPDNMDLTETEKKIGDIWSKLLGLKVSVKKNSNFFALGGNSIGLISVVTEIKKVLGISISMADAYSRPVLSELCEYIEENTNKSTYNTQEISNLQKGIASIQLRDKADTSYNIAFYMIVNENVSLERIYQAWEKLVELNEGIRRVYFVDHGKLNYKTLPYNKEEFEVTTIEDDRVEEYAEKFVHPFDLSEKLFRVAYVRTNNGKKLFFVEIHHIICDQNILKGWIKDLNSLLSGKMPDKKHSRKIAINLDKWSKSKKYWLNYFKNIPEATVLPTDNEYVGKENKLKKYTFFVNSQMVEKLENYASEMNSTMFAVLFAAFFLESMIFSKNSKCIIGTSYLSAIDSNTETMYLQTIPVMVEANSQTRIKEIIYNVQNNFSELLQNNQYTYGELIQDLNSTSGFRTELFKMMFIKEDSFLEYDEISNWFDDIVQINTMSKYDCSMFYHERKGGIEFVFAYNNMIYSENTIMHYAKVYRRIIDQILSNDCINIGELFNEITESPILGAEKFMKNDCIRMFEENCKNYPNRIAIVDNNKAITYSELQFIVDKVAGKLNNYSVRNKVVAFSLENSDKLLITILAILKAGAIYLPLDTNFTNDYRNYILQDSESVFLISENENVINSSCIQGITFEELVSGEAEKIENVCVESEKNVYCIYTSGSTGHPKGCFVNQNGIANYTQWVNSCYCKNKHKIFAFYTSPAVDLSVTSTLIPLLSGHTVVVYPNVATSIQKVIQDKRVNIIKATPSHLLLLNQEMLPSESVETIIVGGEIFYAELAKKVSELFDRPVDIYNEYGPTEATVACMAYKYNPDDKNTVIPIGKPIDNMHVAVLDKNGTVCPPNDKGELYIGGVGVVEGYINRKRLTSEKFRYHEIKDLYSGMMYSTGDIVRMLDDGNYEFCGREDDQIKINGRRIELEEINNIVKNIDGLKHSETLSVTGKNHTKYIALFYSTVEGSKLSEEQLREILVNKLPYYMIPAKIIYMDYFPISNGGKVDKNYLKQMIEKKEDKKNNNDIITFIKNCIIEYIGKDDIDENDGFFEIGFDSISIIELQKKIAQKYNLDVADFFRYPSIKSLALFLENKYGKDTEEETVVESEDLFAIVGMSFELPGASSIKELRQIFLEEQSVMHYTKGTRLDDEIAKAQTEGYNLDEIKPAMVASLSRIDLFPYRYFNIGKDEAEVIDPIQRIFMVHCARALSDSGYTRDNIKGKKGAIIAAKPSRTGYAEYIDKYYPSKSKLNQLNYVESIMLSRVQHFFDIKGPSYLVDSACSSGLVAMLNACKHLKNDECEFAIVGGVNLIQILDYIDRDRADVLSNNFNALTFSDLANGTSRGEGCICFVIKKLEDAKKNNDKVYALVRGGSINNDGFSASLTAPNGFSQTAVIQDALRKAHVSINEVGMIEAHGTGTKLGDPIEIQALSEVEPNSKKYQVCALSASKAYFGHLDSIAGLLGILKCIVSLQYDELYSNYQMLVPNKKIDFWNSRFYVPMLTQKWEVNENNTRICGVSSFGLSGTNAHIILQQSQEKYLDIDIPVIKEMKMERCWIEEKAELKNNFYEVKNEKINRIECYSKQHISEVVLKKIKQLYPDAEGKLYDNLYAIGFDSISIIQLQQFIKKEFDLNIDISTFFDELNSATLIIDYIYKNLHCKAHCKKTEQVYLPKNTYNYKCEEEQFEKISDEALQIYLEKFSPNYISKTQKSYDVNSQDQIYWANGRFVQGRIRGMEKLSYPIISQKAKGAYMWDIDGNQYVDYAMGFGANFFGYNNGEIASAVEKTLIDQVQLGALKYQPFQLAKIIHEMTGVERIAFCNSGSEAIMNLLRIARAATNRKKIISFKGSFHGTFDPIYTQADKSGSEMALPLSIGTPEEYVGQTILFDYGNNKIFDYIEERYDDIAAIVVEPVQSRHPNLRPKEFLIKLREETQKRGILLIFDEVITGFRTGLRGAQEYFNINADLVAYGKVIGGGFPIGIFGGKSIYMDLIDHKGWSKNSQNDTSRFLVNTGGTFNAHPVSVAAAMTVCKMLKRDGNVLYQRMNQLTEYLANTLNAFFEEEKVDIKIEFFCSQFIFVSSDIRLLRILQYHLISKGIYVWEGGTCFVSSEHSEEEINQLIEAVKESCLLIKDNLLKSSNKVNIRQEAIKTYPMTRQQISVLANNINGRRTGSDVSWVLLKNKDLLDKEKMERAINLVIKKYEWLRGEWKWRKVEKPVIIINNFIETKINYYSDYSNIEDLISSLIQERKKTGFPLNKLPYFQLDMIKSKNQETYILISYLTSFVDGWSLDLMLRELTKMYYDIKEDDKEIYDYNEYLKWINNIKEKEKARLFWKDRLRIQQMQPEFAIAKVTTNIKKKKYSFSSQENQILLNIMDKYLCSKASIITYCYAKAIMKNKLNITIGVTVNGRNPNIKGMTNSIGLYSNIQPIQVYDTNNAKEDIEYIDKYLKEINQLVPLDINEICEMCKIDKQVLHNILQTSTIAFLNQIQVDDNSKWEVIVDNGMVDVPFRMYVSFGKKVSILFTFDDLSITESEIENIWNLMKACLKEL